MAESLESKVDKLDKSLRALRKTVSEQETGLRREMSSFSYIAAASALAGALFALTGSLWAIEESDYGDKVFTLWGLMSEGWSGLLAVVLVAAAGIGTLVAFGATQPSRGGHITMTVICVLTAIAVLMITTAIDLDDDATTLSPRWLSALIAVALSMLHGTRAGELRHRS